MAKVTLMFDKSNPKSVSRCRQSFKDECNINSIMAKARKTGMVSISSKEAFFGDCSGADDFHAAQNKLIAAKAGFDSLPARIRAMFDHDAGKLIDWLDDPVNEAEAIKLGLLPVKVPVLTPEQIAADKAKADSERRAALKDDLKAVGVNVA